MGNLLDRTMINASESGSACQNINITFYNHFVHVSNQIIIFWGKHVK